VCLKLGGLEAIKNSLRINITCEFYVYFQWFATQIGQEESTDTGYLDVTKIYGKTSPKYTHFYVYLSTFSLD
jgi:hypothetical protein